MDVIVNLMLIMLNTVVCITIVWCALRRLNLMSHARTLPRYGALYLALLGGAVFAAVSPAIFWQVPHIAQIIVELILIGVLYEGCCNWHTAPPAHTCRRCGHS